MNTQWGNRFRLRVSLSNRSVNVRIHACKECDFIEWGEPTGEIVAVTELSDSFVSELESVIEKGNNRCLPQLVPEGMKALGEYSEANLRLFKK